MATSFETFDWENDERWIKYRNSIEIVSGNENFAKVKFYKKTIDPNYAPPSETKNTSPPSSPNLNDEGQSRPSPQPPSSPSSSTPRPSSSSRPSSTNTTINEKLDGLQILGLVASAYIVINVILFIIPLGMEWSFSCYRHVLFSALIVYSISLYYFIKELGPIRTDITYILQVTSNDNAIYILLCISLFINAPTIFAIAPMGLYAILRLNDLPKYFPQFIEKIPIIKTGFQKVTDNRRMILFAVAYCEVMTFMFIVINLFIGQANFVNIVTYYWFISRRYRTSYFTQLIVHQTAQRFDSIFYHPYCPSIIRTIYQKIRSFTG